MDLAAARNELDQAHGPASVSGERRHAVQKILTKHGAAALGMEHAATLSLTGIIEHAQGMASTKARREFALLLVLALRDHTTVRPKSNTAKFDRNLCNFIESALLNPLRRAAYPFGGSTYDKLRFLESLHATIDEHLQPPEPTFPPWLSGLREHRKT